MSTVIARTELSRGSVIVHMGGIGTPVCTPPACDIYLTTTEINYRTLCCLTSATLLCCAAITSGERGSRMPRNKSSCARVSRPKRISNIRSQSVVFWLLDVIRNVGEEQEGGDSPGH